MSASFRHMMRALFCIIILVIGRSFIAMLFTSLLSSFGFLVRCPWFMVSMLIVMDEVNSCALRWSTGERSVGCISDPRMSANAWMTSGLSYVLSFFNPIGSLIRYPDTGCAFLNSSMDGHKLARILSLRDELSFDPCCTSP